MVGLLFLQLLMNKSSLSKLLNKKCMVNLQLMGASRGAKTLVWRKTKTRGKPNKTTKTKTKMKVMAKPSTAKPKGVGRRREKENGRKSTMMWKKQDFVLFLV